MRAAILLSTAYLFSIACSRTGIAVGSKNFTEQLILGEIIAQQIEGRLHVSVDRKLNLGGTLLAHEALAGGSIDLYPEYTGTAIAAVLKESPQGDETAAFARLNDAYRKRWQLEWMPPLGFENTFAMVVTGDRARAGGISSLSDAARQAEPWRLGAGYEFAQRADGLPGLIKAYGLRLRGSPVIMDLGLLYRSLENGQTDIVAGNSTDGIIAAHHLTVLADDKHYFPRYDCGIIVRESALNRVAGLQNALAELSGKISDVEMRRMNHEVDGKHRTPREVAGEFLAANERK
jgi:glycine betaine/choline ABC-type transport system substrate-binding protein